MNELKPGDKVWVEATYEMDSANNGWSRVFIELGEGNRELVYVPISTINRDRTEELTRLREFVELQPCFCQRGLVKLCDRCYALGKEKS